MRREVVSCKRGKGERPKTMLIYKTAIEWQGFSGVMDRLQT